MLCSYFRHSWTVAKVLRRGALTVIEAVPEVGGRLAGALGQSLHSVAPSGFPACEEACSPRRHGISNGHGLQFNSWARPRRSGLCMFLPGLNYAPPATRRRR